MIPYDDWTDLLEGGSTRFACSMVDMTISCTSPGLEIVFHTSAGVFFDTVRQ